MLFQLNVIYRILVLVVLRWKEKLYLDFISQYGIKDFMFIFGPSVKSKQVKSGCNQSVFVVRVWWRGYILMKCLFWTSFGGNYEDVWYVIKATGVKIIATGQWRALIVPSSPARHKATVLLQGDGNMLVSDSSGH